MRTARTIRSSRSAPASMALAIVVALLWLCRPASGEDAVRAAPLKVCLISGSAEYKSDDSLTVFKAWIEKHYDVECTLVKAAGEDRLPGIVALETCDVALFFTRRLKVAGRPLERVKKYCLAGKPIVAVRTASHGFQNWLEFDKLVLGGNYHNHHPDGPTNDATLAVKPADHPVLAGVTPLRSVGSLYLTSPLADDCTVLMTGRIPGAAPEPVTWTRDFKGGRVVYTSLGHPKDFEEASFQRLLVNSLFWAAKREVATKAAEAQ